MDEKREAVQNKLRQDVCDAINRVSAENGSNTPDFILAEYLVQCLATFDHVVTMRDDWYGVHLEPANKFFRQEGDNK